MALDPVCEMEVDENSAKFQSQSEGQTVYFCSETCKTEFDRNPEQYASAA